MLIVVGSALAGLLASCNGDDRSSQPPAVPSTTSTLATEASSTSSSAVTTTTSPDYGLTATSRLRLDGIGAVRVGMTLTEASRAIGKPLRVDPNSGPDPRSCGFAEPPGGPDVSFMVIDGRVERVDVYEGSPVVTVSGLGLGASEAEVMRVYGRNLRIQPHPYSRVGRYLIYESPEPSQRGLAPHLRDPEGRGNQLLGWPAPRRRGHRRMLLTAPAPAMPDAADIRRQSRPWRKIESRYPDDVT